MPMRFPVPTRLARTPSRAHTHLHVLCMVPPHLAAARAKPVLPPQLPIRPAPLARLHGGLAVHVPAGGSGPGGGGGSRGRRDFVDAFAVAAASAAVDFSAAPALIAAVAAASAVAAGEAREVGGAGEREATSSSLRLRRPPTVLGGGLPAPVPPSADRQSRNARPPGPDAERIDDDADRINDDEYPIQQRASTRRRHGGHGGKQCACITMQNTSVMWKMLRMMMNIQAVGIFGRDGKSTAVSADKAWPG